MAPPTQAKAPAAPPAAGDGVRNQHPSAFGPPYWGVPPECIPDLTDIQIEDGKPVDSIFTEKQSRLLVEPLFTSWKGGAEARDFVAMADVGLFYAWKEPPLVPDFLLSMDVIQEDDYTDKGNQSYFLWLRKKLPEVTGEIVSNLEGGEDTDKLLAYARIGVPYYFIHDPWNLLKGGVLRVFELHRRKYKLIPSVPVMWLEDVGLGLTLWQGTFEGSPAIWLRWCDKDGNLLLTGAEAKEQEKRRADEADRREAEQRQRADQANQEVERLRAKLRELGAELPPEPSAGARPKKKRKKS